MIEKFYWTEDAVTRLKALRAAGKTGREIAAEMFVTRNMVIGKLTRLGLIGKDAPKYVQPKATSSKPKPPDQARLTVKPAPIKPAKPCDDLSIPESRRVRLIDLTRTDCRFPLGDPAKDDFAFCGAAVRAGSSYFGFHGSLCYRGKMLLISRSDARMLAAARRLAQATL